MGQIRHVQTMPKNGYWVESRREKGVLYRNDPIREIFGLGERSADVLQNKYKISTVNDLKELSEEKLNTIVREKELARFTPVRVAGWVAIAKGCRDANAPEPIDHRKHTNPYVSKFGDNDWEHYCDKAALNSQICITALIDHIFDTTKKFYNPNQGDDNEWWVYHDALSLMTAKESVEYMKRKEYYSHWILPEGDLMNDGTEDLKAYRSAPVGNSPEIMPLDCSLNFVFHSFVA